MVSAWASDNRLVLGQTKVDERSNEIKAIPKLLRVLEVSGCIVTIDAIGRQKEIQLPGEASPPSAKEQAGINSTSSRCSLNRMRLPCRHG